MSGLKRILVQEGVNLSLGESRTLIDRLNSCRRRLLVTFLILFLMLSALIVFGCYGLWHYLECGSASEATAWAGAVGLGGGSASLVEILRRIWSEWARTSLVIALVADAPRSFVNVIIQKLIDRL